MDANKKKDIFSLLMPKHGLSPKTDFVDMPENSLIPDAAREVSNSLEVMRGLAFTCFIIFLVLLGGDSFDGRPLPGRVAVMLNALLL